MGKKTADVAAEMEFTRLLKADYPITVLVGGMLTI
jgi:hypothetical protein